ncbi:hypothetical protein Tco_0069841, partial [Tanacetum coccineum]
VEGLLRGNKLEELADTHLGGNYIIEDEMQQLVEVALWCIQVSPFDRSTYNVGCGQTPRRWRRVRGKLGRSEYGGYAGKE